MSRIHIARNRQSLGQFSPEEVAEGLQTGEFVSTDLAWREPMESWKPLGEFTDLPAVEIALMPPALAEPAPAPPELVEPAWERRAELGMFTAIYLTVQQVFSHTTVTFQTMKQQGGFGTPLGLYVLLLTLTTWISTVYQIVAYRINPDEMLGPLSTQVTPEMIVASLVITMVLAPFFIVAGAFISAGIFHLALMALASAKKPYEATFRAVCYAMAPASLFQLMPLCGGMLYIISGLVLLIIALREVHQTNTVRATAGVIIPFVFCCGLFIGLFAVTQLLAK